MRLDTEKRDGIRYLECGYRRGRKMEKTRAKAWIYGGGQRWGGAYGPGTPNRSIILNTFQ